MRVCVGVVASRAISLGVNVLVADWAASGSEIADFVCNIQHH